MAACLLTSLALGSAALAAARFSITLLMTPSTSAFIPLAVSDTGLVTGVVETSTLGIYHAFVRSNNVISEIPTLASGAAGATTDAFGWGINQNAEVVGSSRTSPQGPRHAFLYRNGQLTDLSAQVGGPSSQAFDINDVGQIVGTFGVNPDFGHAYVLSPNKPVVDLGPGVAYAISNTGYVVGETLDTQGKTAPFVFRDADANGALDAGELVLLRTLGSAENNLATGVNDSGMVVGNCSDGSGTSHAMLWNALLPGGAPQELGTFGGGARATGINNAGQVVGTSKSHAFLWEGGRFKDLSALIPTAPGSKTPRVFLLGGNGISNVGQIVGSGVSPRNTHFAVGFLLNPRATPPPPGTLALASLTIKPNTIFLRPTRRTVTTTLTLTANPKRKLRLLVVLKFNGQVVPSPHPLYVTLNGKKSGTLKLHFGPQDHPGAYEVGATYGGVSKTATLAVEAAPPTTL